MESIYLSCRIPTRQLDHGGSWFSAGFLETWPNAVPARHSIISCFPRSQKKKEEKGGRRTKERTIPFLLASCHFCNPKIPTALLAATGCCQYSSLLLKMTTDCYRLPQTATNRLSKKNTLPVPVCYVDAGCYLYWGRYWALCARYQTILARHTICTLHG